MKGTRSAPAQSTETSRYGRPAPYTSPGILGKPQTPPAELVLQDWGSTYEETRRLILQFVEQLDQKYRGQRKGIFMPNDTFANILLNILVNRYGRLPDDYRIVGFDNSPISSEAVIPTSTVSQQIDTIAATAMETFVSQMNKRKKRRPVPLDTPIHKVITPVLICRETTPVA